MLTLGVRWVRSGYVRRTLRERWRTLMNVDERWGLEHVEKSLAFTDVWSATHTPRIRHAYAMHTPRIRHAYAMHMLIIRYLYVVNAVLWPISNTQRGPCTLRGRWEDAQRTSCTRPAVVIHTAKITKVRRSPAFKEIFIRQAYAEQNVLVRQGHYGDVMKKVWRSPTYGAPRICHAYATHTPFYRNLISMCIWVWVCWYYYTLWGLRLDSPPNLWGLKTFLRTCTWVLIRKCLEMTPGPLSGYSEEFYLVLINMGMCDVCIGFYTLHCIILPTGGRTLEWF